MATEASPSDVVPKAMDHRRWGPRIVLVLLCAVGLPVGVSVMLAFPPAEYPIYPGCWFRWATAWIFSQGLHCPGCGATRSTHALLQGDLEQAIAWNPLFIVALPLLAYCSLDIVHLIWTGRNLRYRLPSWAIKVILATLLVYWVLRNIPTYPLTLLAPHEIGS